MKFSLATLSFDCETAVELPDVEDEFKREAAFAKQALETAAKARRLIIAARIPFTRPAGYFCEMLKTDEHMTRIQSKLTEEKEAHKAADLARKQRMNKKYGKKIQVAREQEKQAKVSEEKKKLNMLRKRKRDTKDEFGVEIDDDDDNDVAGGPKRKPIKGGRREQKAVSKKREARNAQYGSGGKKRGLKRNDKESAGHDAFDTARNRAPFRGMKGAGKQKGKQQRPGKARRQQMRSRKQSNK